MLRNRKFLHINNTLFTVHSMSIPMRRVLRFTNLANINNLAAKILGSSTAPLLPEALGIINRPTNNNVPMDTLRTASLNPPRLSLPSMEDNSHNPITHPHLVGTPLRRTSYTLGLSHSNNRNSIHNSNRNYNSNTNTNSNNRMDLGVRLFKAISFLKPEACRRHPVVQDLPSPAKGNLQPKWDSHPMPPLLLLGINSSSNNTHKLRSVMKTDSRSINTVSRP